MSVWSFDYHPHDRFVAPARGTAQIWRLSFGLVLAAGIFLVLSKLMLETIFTLMDPVSVRVILSDGPTAQTAAGMLILLCQLGLLSVAAACVVVMVHSRSPATLIGEPGLALRQFVVVVLGMLVLIVVLLILPPYGFGAPLELNMNVGRWLLLLPFSLIAVLIQTSAEEIFFRGYIQQQLAARFRSPLIWLIVPAVLFGFAHYLPESTGSNAWTIVAWATLFGILMADLTARSGTLGPAIAVHFVNNLSAMLIISVPDEMSGLALYLLPFGMGDEAQMAAWLPVDFGFVLVSWLVARLAIRA
ncbi:CPBP family intramembrane glutamic endopeptidase [uncultured Tateyamaria sp.]|uniref:CPBP family intramembrane glutamic endopeptidase n=1 Tax=uncultured Tateyamaria sp. TaxID=455651 RepID=UPI002613078A|nr:CPBP family intramembrane glutamic endopeptidase [uncultured Tateyamaria sp.]